ncbi:hypothetical protein G7Y31_02785 [Corynebacterium lizhenjunii]|uniref:Uncharacterized protein n=1 Tax=Corynebacterium lizhenjunii TaxID=2709394 RepID=A0A7T0PBP6_9CORY|nr:hypothetical protein [Corynebacterium lizhenjunii]QPK79650.1 hypothetical protein G7Y31_02785 [Corynebacterium lizhenjunii]
MTTFAVTGPPAFLVATGVVVALIAVPMSFAAVRIRGSSAKKVVVLCAAGFAWSFIPALVFFGWLAPPAAAYSLSGNPPTLFEDPELRFLLVALPVWVFIVWKYIENALELILFTLLLTCGLASAGFITTAGNGPQDPLQQVLFGLAAVSWCVPVSCLPPVLTWWTRDVFRAVRNPDSRQTTRNPINAPAASEAACNQAAHAPMNPAKRS